MPRLGLHTVAVRVHLLEHLQEALLLLIHDTVAIPACGIVQMFFNYCILCIYFLMFSFVNFIINWRHAATLTESSWRKALRLGNQTTRQVLSNPNPNPNTPSTTPTNTQVAPTCQGPGP